MYKIAKENLSALFRLIAESQELYLPVRTAEQVNFGVWSEDAEVDLDTLKSVKSPKDAFFPQSENLYTCIKEGKKIQIEPEALKEQKFVVFGMKACDVQGVQVLDKVFLADSGEPKRNRTWVSLKKVYKSLKTESTWQYLPIEDYDDEKDEWKHKNANGNWVQ